MIYRTAQNHIDPNIASALNATSQEPAVQCGAHFALSRVTVRPLCRWKVDEVVIEDDVGGRRAGHPKRAGQPACEQPNNPKQLRTTTCNPTKYYLPYQSNRVRHSTRYAVNLILELWVPIHTDFSYFKRVVQQAQPTGCAQPCRSLSGLP